MRNESPRARNELDQFYVDREKLFSSGIIEDFRLAEFVIPATSIAFKWEPVVDRLTKVFKPAAVSLTGEWFKISSEVERRTTLEATLDNRFNAVSISSIKDYRKIANRKALPDFLTSSTIFLFNPGDPGQLRTRGVFSAISHSGIVPEEDRPIVIARLEELSKLQRQ